MPQRPSTRLAASTATFVLALCAGCASGPAATPTPSIAVTQVPTLAATPAAVTAAVPSASASALGEPTGRILFSAVRPTEAFGSLFVIEAGGSGAPRGLGLGDEPDWSPDGTRIAFVRDDGIWVMNADGTRATAIRHDPTLVVQWPVWSPDGGLLAFDESPTCDLCSIGPPSALLVMKPDGSAVRKVGEATSADRPAWSPDGETLLFAGEQSDPPTAANGLQSIRLDGTDQRQFTTGPDSSPIWSPDGRFAFLRGAATTDDGFVLFQAFVANGDGSSPHALAVPQFIEGPLAWSPDGAWLVMPRTESPRIDAATAQWDLWIVRSDGTDLRNLTHSTDVQEGFPSWE